ncbi:hypothetical protein [Ruficoccus sp. ZRK36]|uniref:hypothetical protein n=1 Tax=Ruficoccus sp. ZRK36 TaxID=2866311 RepID=UPI001C72CE4A|nr:hypothetical protein [Ruficoccus sp. ZRK36]QYY35268.1 hypothetical protein K0V07_13325 [Ruficoccus sp. ZRK36]
MSRLPSPEELFSKASGVTEDSMLFPYRGTLVLLRQRGFSYRGIAKWLSENGLETNHTSVRNFLDSYSRDEELANDFQQAQDEAYITLQRRGVSAPKPDLEDQLEREDEQ